MQMTKRSITMQIKRLDTFQDNAEMVLYKLRDLIQIQDWPSDSELDDSIKWCLSNQEKVIEGIRSEIRKLHRSRQTLG
jgi:hypothetical protein